MSRNIQTLIPLQMSKQSNFDSYGNAGDLGPDDVLVSTHVDEIMSRLENVFKHLLS